MNDIVVQPGGHVPTLTADQIKAQVGLIQKVMKAVMKSGTHFDTIPGCNKPSLMKAGSEVLLTTFRISVEPEVDDLSTMDEIRYRVRAVGRHQSTGIVVGIGIGECSSSEEKYRWRDAVCDEEFDATADDRRRVKYVRKRDGGHYTRQQVRTCPSDVANTVLKMAKKRAQVDLTLTATAASDIFTQDVEDDDTRGGDHREDGAGSRRERRDPSRPRATNGGGDGTATEKQVKLLHAKLGNANVPVADLCAAFQIDSVTALPFDQVNEALAWIQDRAA